MAIEEEFGIEIPDAEADEINTVAKGEPCTPLIIGMRRVGSRCGDVGISQGGCGGSRGFFGPCSYTRRGTDWGRSMETDTVKGSRSRCSYRVYGRRCARSVNTRALHRERCKACRDSQLTFTAIEYIQNVRQ